MGQLADDVTDAFRDARRTGYHRGLAETHQDLIDRIERLERQVADYEAPIMFGELAAPLTNATRTVPDDVITRLADAEQRAAAAWVAVSKLVHSPSTDGDYACVGIHNGAPTGLEYVDNNGHPYHSKLLGYTPRHCVTVVYAVNAPANPDLLERASVELAEAYQRAKAEEQRQAEERQAGPLATTASMDVIAKDFAEGVVAHIKAEAEAERKHPAFGANPSTATPPTDTVTR